MWRAFFLSVGICSVVLGLECLVVDKAILPPSSEHSATGLLEFGSTKLREVSPAEWAPWSLLSAGAVVILYTFTLPQKIKPV